MRQRQACEMVVDLARHRGQARQDLAAALRLAAQQRHVVGVRAAGRKLALQFLGDERDGGERRAEFMRGGGGEAVEGVEMLLAGQHHLGGVQRLRQLPRFLGDAEGVDAGEDAGRNQRHPDAGDVEQRQRQTLRRVPRQRPMKPRETGSQWRRQADREARSDAAPGSSPRR